MNYIVIPSGCGVIRPKEFCQYIQANHFRKHSPMLFEGLKQISKKSPSCLAVSVHLKRCRAGCVK